MWLGDHWSLGFNLFSFILVLTHTMKNICEHKIAKFFVGCLHWIVCENHLSENDNFMSLNARVTKQNTTKIKCLVNGMYFITSASCQRSGIRAAISSACRKSDYIKKYCGYWLLLSSWCVIDYCSYCVRVSKSCVNKLNVKREHLKSPVCSVIQ